MEKMDSHSQLNVSSLDEHDDDLVRLCIANESFSLSKNCLSMSSLLKAIVEECPNDRSIKIEESHVSKDVLKKVVKYLKYHESNIPAEIQSPIVEKSLQGLVDDWDFDFVSKLSPKFLINIINSANYLGIDSLLKLTCAQFACFIKNNPHPADLEKLLS